MPAAKQSRDTAATGYARGMQHFPRAFPLAACLGLASGLVAQDSQTSRVGDGTLSGFAAPVGGATRPPSANEIVGALNNRIEELSRPRASTGSGRVPSPTPGGAQGTNPAAGTTPTGLRIYEPTVEWKDQVAAERANLHGVPVGEVRKALTSERPARILAALEQVARGALEVPESTLVSMLRTTASRPVARALVVLLGSRPGETAREAVEDHVETLGPADDTAVRYLWANPSERSRKLLRQRAALATSRDRASLLAIRAIADDPAPAVTHLLARLAEDRSEAVQAAAQQALKIRGKAGLPLDTPRKAIEYGSSYTEILDSAPEVTDLREFARDTNRRAAEARNRSENDDDDGGGGRRPAPE